MRTEEELRARTGLITNALRRSPSEGEEAVLYAKRDELWWALGLTAPTEPPEPDEPDKEYISTRSFLQVLLEFVLEMFPEKDRQALLEELLFRLKTTGEGKDEN